MPYTNSVKSHQYHFSNESIIELLKDVIKYFIPEPRNTMIMTRLDSIHIEYEHDSGKYIATVVILE